MFDIAERSAFINGAFTNLTWSNNSLELTSIATSQGWLIKKFNKDGFPPTVLYHKHSPGEPYHVHYVFDSDNALLCYSEIMKHERYIIARNRKRRQTTNLSNIQLLRAIKQS